MQNNTFLRACHRGRGYYEIEIVELNETGAK